MRPSQFNSKKEINEMNISRLVKISRDSPFIQKSFLSSSPTSPLTYPCDSSASPMLVSAPTLATKAPPRQPLIIYTRPPKVIHTNPDDFMALVQKLTGLSRPEVNANPSTKKETTGIGTHGPEDLLKVSPKAANSDESETSVVTEDNCHNMILEDVHANSYFPPTPNIFDTNIHNCNIFDTNIHNCFENFPLFRPNMPNDYLCPAPFFNNFNNVDPLRVMPNRRSTVTSPTNLRRSTVTSPTNLEALKEIDDFEISKA